MHLVRQFLTDMGVDLPTECCIVLANEHTCGREAVGFDLQTGLPVCDKHRPGVAKTASRAKRGEIVRIDFTAQYSPLPAA